jgi:hypothetical protein
MPIPYLPETVPAEQAQMRAIEALSHTRPLVLLFD